MNDITSILYVVFYDRYSSRYCLQDIPHELWRHSFMEIDKILYFLVHVSTGLLLYSIRISWAYDVLSSNCGG
jgi:hypothetical protein